MRFIIYGVVSMLLVSTTVDARGRLPPSWKSGSYFNGLGQANTLPVGTMVTYEFCMANPYECRANAYVVQSREVVNYVDKVREAVKTADDLGNITININNFIGKGEMVEQKD